MLPLHRSSGLGYLIAVLGTGVLLATSALLRGSTGSFLTSLVFLLTVLGAGGAAGWRAGLLATLLSVGAALIFIFNEVNFVTLTRAGAYVVAGLLISALCEGLHVSWRRLEDRQRQLELEIAERHKAQVSERQQAERLRVTLASIGDAVITADSEGRVTYLNAVAEALTGYPLRDACGQPLENVFRIIAEQTRLPAANPVERVLKEGKILGLANHTILIARDGIERPIDDSAAPIRDNNGSIVGVVLIFRDVSERRRSEQAIHAAMNQLTIVTESMSALVSRCSSDMKYLWVSKSFADWIGRPVSEIIGQPIAEVLGPEAFEQLRPHFERVLSGQELRFEEAANFRGLGRRWVQDVYTPTRDATGKVDGWVAVVLDIEEQKQAQADLQEADRRKDEFLATLAHELRNPLAPIRNALEIIRLASDDPGLVHEARCTMERQLQQMIHLVDDLLDLSRITRGAIGLRREHADLSTIVQSAVETSRPLIEQAGHRLSLRLPEKSVHVDADVTRLAQVFANLLNNAAKYTNAGGDIELSVQPEGDSVTVRVKDNGIGIPPSKLSGVFEMFSQVDRSLERAHSGLGIGLTIVQRLVEMHGGKVEARSEGERRGSEFLVHLPTVDSSAINAQPFGDELPAACASPRRILVVDDNKDSALSLALMLDMLGNETQVAHDGQEAIDAATAFRPDVILLDIGMPKISGYDVCRAIRQEPWGGAVLIVAVTGWGQAEDRRNSQEAGFNYHLVKPVDPSALRKVFGQLPQSG